VTLSDLAKYSVTQSVARSLRQLSFLFRFPQTPDRYVQVLDIFVAMSMSLNAATVLFATAPICDTDQFPAL